MMSWERAGFVEQLSVIS